MIPATYRTPLCALLCGAASLLGAACEQEAGDHAETAYRVTENQVHINQEGPVQFDVVTATLGTSLALPSIPARVEPVESQISPIFAPLSGRVIETQVHLGDRVSKGQRLVLVRTGELPTLEHDVRAAELSVQTRANTVQRLEGLVASRAGSQNDLIVAQSELDQARLSVKAAKAKVASLQIARADDTSYWVLAARSGSVVQLGAAPGLQVGPESAALLTVADLSAVLVVADVPQGDAGSLSKGGIAHIFLGQSAAEAVEGRIEVISEVVDPARQTVPVRIRVDNPNGKLRPNAFVTLTFDSEQRQDVVRIPAASVVRDGATAVVFVETAHGTFERRAVEVGRQNHDEVEVSSGLRSGERVVKSGALLLLNAIDIRA